jgi:uncharacterized protein YbbC (DUF1343 family)
LIFRIKYFFSLLLICSFAARCQQSDYNKYNFKPAADILIGEQLNFLKDKKVGLVINHTSLLSNGTHLLDTLLSSGITVSAVFTPEHGLFGKLERGEIIDDSKVYGIPVYSLHGKIKKPTESMLSGLDLLIYDIQDLGVRFYTYISTLFYVLEAAVEKNIPVIVLDRPNPNAATNTDGPVLNKNFKSFLGLTEIPVVYAMTNGELSLLYFNEFISHHDDNSLLTIIRMQNWKRSISREENGIDWIPPSPNIPDLETAFVYPGTCLLEGTNISEGRGTDKPFLQIGAPFIASEELLSEMEKYNDGTFELSQISFSPESLAGRAENPKYQNETCNGILIRITAFKKFSAVKFGVNLIYSLHKLYPQSFRFFNDHFDKLAGTDSLRILIQNNQTPEVIINSWIDGLKKFNSLREKYLLY